MDIGPPELLIAVVLVVLLLAPGRVTALARSFGESIREFRDAQADLDTRPHGRSSTGGSVRSPDGGSLADD